MRLVCDEDIGTGVPKALRHVGYDAIALVTLGWAGTPDHVWLRRAGERGWLVFSSNKKMLLVPKEKDAIIQGRVGIIFLTSGEEHTPRVLNLLLTKWDTLRLLAESEPRPFARFLSPNGRMAAKYRHYKL